MNETYWSYFGDWGIHFGPFCFALLYGPKLRCFFNEANNRGAHSPAWASSVASNCHEFCTIVMRAGK